MPHKIMIKVGDLVRPTALERERHVECWFCEQEPCSGFCSFRVLSVGREGEPSDFVRIANRLNPMYVKGVRLSQVEIVAGYWEFCGHCRTPMVKCAACGNNSCNGGYGKADGSGPDNGDGSPLCKTCPAAYEMQRTQTPPEFAEKYKSDLIAKETQYWQGP